MVRPAAPPRALRASAQSADRWEKTNWLAKLRCASLDGGREGLQSRGVTTSSGSSVAVDLLRQRVELIEHRGGILVLSVAQTVGAIEGGLHRAGALGLNALAARQLIHEGERHRGA